jgi:hypothetical protein
MQSAQEPTDTDRSECRGVRLRFDLISKPLVERQSRVPGRVGRLAIQVLHRTGGLICNSLGLALGIACNATKAFLDLPADIFGGACYSVFVHDFCVPEKMIP